MSDLHPVLGFLHKHYIAAALVGGLVPPVLWDLTVSALNRKTEKPISVQSTAEHMTEYQRVALAIQQRDASGSNRPLSDLLPTLPLPASNEVDVISVEPKLLQAAAFVIQGPGSKWSEPKNGQTTNGDRVVAATSKDCVFQTWIGSTDLAEPAKARDFAQIDFRRVTRYSIKNNSPFHSYRYGSLLVLDVEGNKGFYCTYGGTGNARPASPLNPLIASDCFGEDNSFIVRSQYVEELERRVAAIKYIGSQFCPNSSTPY
ncbi:hypothetical protein FV242_01810 [Methylobacterium sp. WL64]|uniref:hypothetical protein n=1 Tax=Methylobacterium sp. WL64 TaxID=2603894 RepID=UPI0011CB2B0E|nr:hypothetical protein [Methylobacterium sp. WL64]TXN05931.1 hypothetical protein FV242_01810 [Methylobacterium sp. WL64]